MRDTYAPTYNQRRRRRSPHTARLMRGITIALIVVLLILSAICFVAGFVLFNMATGEW